MRVGIVFHKDPFAPPTGIDLVRLRAIASGLIRRGIEAEIVSPVDRDGILEGIIPVRPLAVLSERAPYDLLKTSYHFSLELMGEYTGPVVSRIVRVVDDQLPERDEPFRYRLLDCQERLRKRSTTLVLNNEQNAARWRQLYGDHPPIVLVPTGCPARLPQDRANPYNANERVMLFLGSLAAPRMVEMVNQAAHRLKGRCRIHLVGLNKACLYGAKEQCLLDPLIINHGELLEQEVWDYVRNADVGLALATGQHPFDNDVSKILTYLRGGLPVLSEEPIVNNELVRQTGYGKTFAYGDLDELVFQTAQLLERPPLAEKSRVMEFMASEPSWDRRVDTYVELFRRIVPEKL